MFPWRRRRAARPEAARNRGVGEAAAALCVASGKGGTGKSMVASALATLFSQRASTLLVDADLGVGNAHILQDVSPERTLVDVALRGARARDALCRCPSGPDLLAGGSGFAQMANLRHDEFVRVARVLAEVEVLYARSVIDSAAGLSEQTLAFAAASEQVLVVTTPDVTAMTDAYAFLKVLHARSPRRKPMFIINRCRSEEEARHAASRIKDVSQRFLGFVPEYLGGLPEDPAASESIRRRAPVPTLRPDSRLAKGLGRLALELDRRLNEQRGSQILGMGRRLVDEASTTLL